MNRSRTGSGWQPAGRAPGNRELKPLLEAREQFFAQHVDRPDAAKQLLSVGERQRDPQRDPVAHAAATLTALLILNLDETLTKE